MLRYYSKPSADIQEEMHALCQNDRALFKKQLAISKILLKCGYRKICLLCDEPLKGETFLYRRISFAVCKMCGHIQTSVLPPPGYPAIKFNTVYPKLSADKYADRKNRIYRPKLDWIMQCCRDLGYSERQLIKKTWLEIGCGTGYFLSCLKEKGIKNVIGLDADKDMVAIANSLIKGSPARHYNGNPADIIRAYPSEIIVGFFVLEHISQAHSFYKAMKNLPKGTLFIFSIPILGFTNILEMTFRNNYARHLDCVFHTQLYTKPSLDYAMRLSGFKILAEWIFGEDSLDLSRFILTNTASSCSNGIARMRKKLIAAQDLIQTCLDQMGMSDQRHILAIKT